MIVQASGDQHYHHVQDLFWYIIRNEDGGRWLRTPALSVYIDHLISCTVYIMLELKDRRFCNIILPHCCCKFHTPLFTWQIMNCYRYKIFVLMSLTFNFISILFLWYICDLPLYNVNPYRSTGLIILNIKHRLLKYKNNT